MTVPHAQPGAIDSAPSAMSAADLCNSLENSMEVLIELIEQECELVRAGKLDQAQAVHAAKAKCAQAYVEAHRLVKAQAERLHLEAPQAVAALNQRHQEFRSLLQLNMAALMAAKAVSEDLVRTVAETAGQAARPDTYGAAGALASSSKLHRGLSVNSSA